MLSRVLQPGNSSAGYFVRLLYDVVQAVIMVEEVRGNGRKKQEASLSTECFPASRCTNCNTFSSPSEPTPALGVHFSLSAGAPARGSMSPFSLTPVDLPDVLEEGHLEDLAKHSLHLQQGQSVRSLCHVMCSGFKGTPLPFWTTRCIVLFAVLFVGLCYCFSAHATPALLFVFVLLIHSTR